MKMKESQRFRLTVVSARGRTPWGTDSLNTEASYIFLDFGPPMTGNSPPPGVGKREFRISGLSRPLDPRPSSVVFGSDSTPVIPDGRHLFECKQVRRRTVEREGTRPLHDPITGSPSHGGVLPFSQCRMPTMGSGGSLSSNFVTRRGGIAHGR